MGEVGVCVYCATETWYYFQTNPSQGHLNAHGVESGAHVTPIYHSRAVLAGFPPRGCLKGRKSAIFSAICAIVSKLHTNKKKNCVAQSKQQQQCCLQQPYTTADLKKVPKN